MSEMMVAAGLHGWAEAALCVFLAAFAVQAWLVLRPRAAKTMAHLQSLPLHDDPTSCPGDRP